MEELAAITADYPFKRNGDSPAQKEWGRAPRVQESTGERKRNKHGLPVNPHDGGRSRRAAGPLQMPVGTSATLSSEASNAPNLRGAQAPPPRGVSRVFGSAPYAASSPLLP